MKILFVRPRPSPETIGLQHVMVVEPLELEVLAALVSPDDRPVIIDMILERESFEFHLRREAPDVVCVTGYITHIGTMIEYCRTVKRWNPAVWTIVGGVHCEVCPGHLEDEAVDFRVVRNAVRAFPELLGFLKNGGKYPGNGYDLRGNCYDLPAGVLSKGEALDRSALPSFDFSFPLPDRSLTARYRKSYFYLFHEPVALMKTAFGCPYKCNFCFCRAIVSGKYHERPMEGVITELRQIREKEIYIVDDDFLVSRERVERFIEENRRYRLDKSYLIYGRADFVAGNPDLIARFKEAGLRTVIVGFESFFEDELERYAKGTDVAANREAMAVMRRHGIDCYATVIIPPHWTRHHFRHCRRVMKDLGIHYVNLQPLTPLPGTGFEVPDRDLVFDRHDYPKWDLAHVTLRPRHLSVREFYLWIIRLYNALLFRPAVLWGYLRKYRARQLWKMLLGTLRVRNQYSAKIREASPVVAEVTGHA
jgi:radical SAM superfamily enzyme YgiQ (UPF0313 family)